MLPFGGRADRPASRAKADPVVAEEWARCSPLAAGRQQRVRVPEPIFRDRSLFKRLITVHFYLRAIEVATWGILVSPQNQETPGASE